MVKESVAMNSNDRPEVISEKFKGTNFIRCYRLSNKFVFCDQACLFERSFISLAYKSCDFERYQIDIAFLFV